MIDVDQAAWAGKRGVIRAPADGLQLFRLADLRRALDDESFWAEPVTPISRHRAIAQVANPRADEDDVVLIVATDGEELVGYMGIVPDYIYLDDTPTKLGWLSTWWVRPDRKATGVGGKILLRAIGAYRGSIGVTSFTPAASRVYEASRQFVPLRDLAGWTLLLRRPGDGVRSAAMNVLIDRRLHAWTARSKEQWPELRVEYLRQFDGPTRDFLGDAVRTQLTRRGPEQLQWILDERWLLNGPLWDRSHHTFTGGAATCCRLEFHSVKVLHRGALAGWFLLKFHDGHLHVPYCWHADDAAAGTLATVLWHAAALGAAALSLYQPTLLDALSRCDVPLVDRRPATLRSIIGRRYADVDFSVFDIQPGEGDAVFC